MEVRALVRGAAAMVFPSIYEGFGLPPVEAIVQGVPVACSEIEPHREGLSGVEPGSVAWVDSPRVPKAWAAVLTRIGAGELRAPSPETSRALSERFSTARLGATMAACYRDVLTSERGD